MLDPHSLVRPPFSKPTNICPVFKQLYLPKGKSDICDKRGSFDCGSVAINIQLGHRQTTSIETQLKQIVNNRTVYTHSFSHCNGRSQ